MSFDIKTYIERLRAAGEPNRLRILSLLQRGELAVGELAQIMEQSQPRLSHHLKALTNAELVERMPEGAWVFYSIPAAGPIRTFLDDILSPIDRESGDFAADLRRLGHIQRARSDAAATYFSEVADTWDTVRGLHSENELIERRLLEMASRQSFKRIIDIGTGTGRMLSLFSEFAERLDGVDLSHRMLTVARANLDKDGVSHAHVRHGDAGNLPYEDDSADLVIIHQVLHFIDEPDRVLSEASRILEDSGKLLVVDFAPHNLEFLREEHGHRRLGIRHAALSEWSEQAGLKLQAPKLCEHPINAQDGLTVQIWSAQKCGPKVFEQKEATV